MSKALVVGGNSGIGLAMVMKLLDKGYEHIYIAGKDAPRAEDVGLHWERFQQKTSFRRVDLVQENYSYFDTVTDIDTLVITAGFGRVAPFEALTEPEVTNLIKCNQLGAIRVIQKYYKKIRSSQPFYCAVELPDV